jgi:hypothetical protein
MVSSEAAAAGLSGFLEWSEPVIFDRLLDAYRARLGRGSSPFSLARLHARTWRALISCEMQTFAVLRRDLLGALAECHLGVDDLISADNDILVELLEVVMGRYQRSMSTAKNYHLALIALAVHLAPPAQTMELPIQAAPQLRAAA